MNNFQDKNVLVFGLGLNQGGVGSAKFFVRNGAKVRVTDLKSADILKPSLDQLKKFKNISYTLGGHKYEDIEWADLVIKNPAVKPGNPYIDYATKKRKQVEMDMGIFLQFVNASQIIGVTGTKGKSTTASLIYEVLSKCHPELVSGSDSKMLKLIQHDGIKIILAGNIGRSVLDIITMMQNSTIAPLGWKASAKDKFIVLEISSFQLEAFDIHKVSPKWAIVTNIYEDHLNYYKNMDEYIASKKVIGKYQTKNDFLFINEDDPKISTPQFLEGFKGKIIFYSQSDLPENFTPHLIGEHNKSNMAAALALGKQFRIDEKSILNTLKNFKGIPFRMELVKIWNGVRIINDTTATGPDASIQAIKTLHSHSSSGNMDGRLILIAGGMNKGMDYTQYVTIVERYVNKVFFLEGDATDAIISSLRAQRSNLTIHGPYNDLEKLLKDVKSETKSEDTILFSPAATSFNLFQNEFDRGWKFNEAVRKVFKDA